MARKIDLGLVNGKLIVTEDDEKNITRIARNGAAYETILSMNAYTGYEGFENIIGLQVDYENNKFTRLGAAKGLEAGNDFDKFLMFGGMRRCQIDLNGNIVENEVEHLPWMVYVPKFYYRVVPLKLEENTDTGLGYHIRKANYYISSKKYPGFKLHPAFYNEQGQEVDYFFYSAYEGALFEPTTNDDRYEGRYRDDSIHKSTETNEFSYICSSKDQKPISAEFISLSMTSAEKYCTNNGNGWHCETIKALSALQFLMMIEYGSMNLQNELALGVVNIHVPVAGEINEASSTGSTDFLNSKSGIAKETINKKKKTIYANPDKDNEAETTIYTENGKVAFSYRGIENPYGNIWRLIQGINIFQDAYSYGREIYICNDFNYKQNHLATNYENCGFAFFTVNSSGYISAMGYGNTKFDWLFFPTEFKGTSVSPIGDYFDWYNKIPSYVSDFNQPMFGNYWSGDVQAGLFSYRNLHGGAINGCRLIYLPQN